MRYGIAASMVLVPLLAAGCGGKGGGTTIVLTTSTTPAPALRAYRVPAGSMEPTVATGEYVFAESMKAPPHVGDIIIFHPPEGAQQLVCGPTAHVIKAGGEPCSQSVPKEAGVSFIKRIVAGPGDVVSIHEGHVIRNGTPEKDSYIRSCAGVPECNFPTPIRIPAGDWFTLGDNRGESDDSRFWGPVPLSWIVGVVRSCSQIGTPCAGP